MRPGGLSVSTWAAASRPGVRALLEFFDSREFRRLVNSLAGYRSVAKLDWLNAMDIIQ